METVVLPAQDHLAQERYRQSRVMSGMIHPLEDLPRPRRKVRSVPQQPFVAASLHSEIAKVPSEKRNATDLSRTGLVSPMDLSLGAFRSSPSSASTPHLSKALQNRIPNELPYGFIAYESSSLSTATPVSSGVSAIPMQILRTKSDGALLQQGVKKGVEGGEEKQVSDRRRAHERRFESAKGSAERKVGEKSSEKSLDRRKGPERRATEKKTTGGVSSIQLERSSNVQKKTGVVTILQRPQTKEAAAENIALFTGRPIEDVSKHFLKSAQAVSQSHMKKSTCEVATAFEGAEDGDLRARENGKAEHVHSNGFSRHGSPKRERSAKKRMSRDPSSKAGARLREFPHVGSRRERESVGDLPRVRGEEATNAEGNVPNRTMRETSSQKSRIAQSEKSILGVPKNCHKAESDSEVELGRVLSGIVDPVGLRIHDDQVGALPEQFLMSAQAVSQPHMKKSMVEVGAVVETGNDANLFEVASAVNVVNDADLNVKPEQFLTSAQAVSQLHIKKSMVEVGAAVETGNDADLFEVASAADVVNDADLNVKSEQFLTSTQAVSQPHMKKSMVEVAAAIEKKSMVEVVAAVDVVNDADLNVKESGEEADHVQLSGRLRNVSPKRQRVARKKGSRAATCEVVAGMTDGLFAEVREERSLEWPGMSIPLTTTQALKPYKGKPGLAMHAGLVKMEALKAYKGKPRLGMPPGLPKVEALKPCKGDPGLGMPAGVPTLEIAKSYDCKPYSREHVKIGNSLNEDVENLWTSYNLHTYNGSIFSKGKANIVGPGVDVENWLAMLNGEDQESDNGVERSAGRGGNVDPINDQSCEEVTNSDGDIVGRLRRSRDTTGGGIRQALADSTIRQRRNFQDVFRGSYENIVKSKHCNLEGYFSDGDDAGVDLRYGPSSPPQKCERWAGPAYTKSPPPSTLPFPTIPLQRVKLSEIGWRPFPDANSEPLSSSAPPSPTHNASRFLSGTAMQQWSLVDPSSATKDLRRMLNLDVADGFERGAELSDGSVESATQSLKRILQLD